MKITLIKKLGEVKLTKAPIRKWKQNSSSFTLACIAGLHYTKKFKKRMVIVSTTNYMQKVCHIVHEDKDISTYTVFKKNCSVGVVLPNGEVWQGLADD